MNLLLELHGDLPEHFPTDERRLYIFGCCRKTCNRKAGSIRVLRATKKVKEAQPESTKEVKENGKDAQSQAPKQDLGASLFGAAPLNNGSQSGNANPFSYQSSSSSQANPFSAQSTAPTQQQPASNNDISESFADKVRISEPEPSTQSQSPAPKPTAPQTPWPAQSAFAKPYPQRYLDAEYETLSRPSTPTIPETATMEPMDEGGSSSGGGAADLKDAFESELDKAFIRFSSRLAQNPEQVLRYEFGGSPLLYSHSDETGKRLHPPHHALAGAKITTLAASGGGSRMPRCEYCGSGRVFELQLVPHAISVLEEELGLDDAGMEWGTIILGVCGRDCGPKEIGETVWREEYAGVQWEETK